MNLQDKFWYLLIKIRDYEYHLTLQNYGEKTARLSKGKRDIRVLVTLIYIGILFILAYLLHYYGNVSREWIRFLRESVPTGLVLSVLFIFLPIFGTSEYMFKKMESFAPIPEQISEETYQEGRRLFIYSLIVCGFFCFGFSFILMRYVIDGIDLLFGIQR